MPVFSCLRTPAVAGARTTLAQAKHFIQQNAPVRKMSGNVMPVKASSFQRHRLRDNFVYFTALGVIPLGLFTTYLNIFVGPAELQEIPEGYVPEPHEYHKGPVQRVIAKYLITSPEKNHERSVYYVYKAEQMRQTSILNEKFKTLSEQRRDEKGWFYVPLKTPHELTEKAAQATDHASVRLEYHDSVEK